MVLSPWSGPPTKDQAPGTKDFLTGNGIAVSTRSTLYMNRLHGLLLAVLATWPAAVSAQAPIPQKQKTDVKTLVGSYALEVTPEYLGMANKKTVVRLRLSSPELSKAASSRGVRAVSGEVRGTFASAGQVIDTFRYPVTGDVEGGRTFTYSFLRAVPPGTYHVQLFFNDPGGRQVGKAEVDLFVPEIGTVFRPEMAPADSSTLPEAEAIVLADSAANAGPAASEPKLKILAPDREAPLGLLRLTAEIEPPITKVEFYLDERLLVARNRPPYSVEIDLGSVPGARLSALWGTTSPARSSTRTPTRSTRAAHAWRCACSRRRMPPLATCA